jgi:hypothetical protein
MLHRDDYISKIKEFITQNNFTKLPHDITDEQQQNIRNKINNSKNTTKKEKLKLRVPHICSTIKLYKQHNPIRPINVWKDSPGYIYEYINNHATKQHITAAQHI